MYTIMEKLWGKKKTINAKEYKHPKLVPKFKSKRSIIRFLEKTGRKHPFYSVKHET